MTDAVTVPIDYNEPIADNGACVGELLEAEVWRLRKALDEARSAKVSNADTVTVPRWALERVINSAVPPKLWAPRAGLEKWAGAMTALKCALDTKAEMPDEPPKPGPPEGWHPDHSWR